MDEAQFKKYKSNYQGIITAVVLAILVPIVIFFFDIRSLNTGKDVVIILAIVYTYKISRMPKFEGQQSISMWVALWCGSMVIASVNFILQMSSDSTYMWNDKWDFLSIFCLIVQLVSAIVIIVKCYQNNKILNRFKDGSITQNSVEL